MNFVNEIKMAIEYIESNLDKDINFEKVAKEVGMSISKIIRKKREYK